MSWLTDIRKVALLACVTFVASLIMPLWNSTQSASPLWVLMFLLTALPPTFYFALYRDQGSLRVSQRLRLMARTAAFIQGVLLAFQLEEWIKSLASPVPTLLGTLATIATILLLVALSRNPGEQSDEDAIVSTLLYVVTKVTVFAWGGWVAFNLLRVVALPYVYSQTRHYLISIGRDRPILADMAKEVVPAFLSQACLLAAPYIVYRSNRAPTASAGTDPSDTAPPAERSPDSAPDT